MSIKGERIHKFIDDICHCTLTISTDGIQDYMKIFIKFLRDDDPEIGFWYRLNDNPEMLIENIKNDSNYNTTSKIFSLFYQVPSRSIIPPLTHQIVTYSFNFWYGCGQEYDWIDIAYGVLLVREDENI